jgi:hypothetical protein
MKSPFATAIAIGFGLVVLAGYFLQPLLSSLMSVLLGWAVILGAVAGLVGILNLMIVHLNKIRSGKKGYLYSGVTILAFIFTLLGGIVLGPSNAQFKQVVTSIMLPIEASFMALLAITLAYTSIRLLRQRGINLLSVSFAISAVAFLLLNLGFLNIGGNSVMSGVVEVMNRLPMAGARGILLGVALGSLTAGLRILIGTDRPYGG